MVTNKYKQIKNITEESPYCELEKDVLGNPSQKYAEQAI